MNRSFDWLGRFPLAVDLADTIRVIGSEEVDLLGDEESLATWVEIERKRFPLVEAARDRVCEVRQLRGAVRELLFAAAEGRPAPAKARSEVNRASALSPAYPVLEETGEVTRRELGKDPFDEFRAAVARSAMDVTTGPQRKELKVCRSPGCGMLFVRSDARQRWCSPACGNRARVARHAARRDHSG